MSEDECVATHPSLALNCQMSARAHKTAHHAGGVVDGVRWTPFWWDVAAATDEAEQRADQPVRRSGV
jgi:hypothetical protein